MIIVHVQINLNHEVTHLGPILGGLMICWIVTHNQFNMLNYNIVKWFHVRFELDWISHVTSQYEPQSNGNDNTLAQRQT